MPIFKKPKNVIIGLMLFMLVGPLVTFAGDVFAGGNSGSGGGTGGNSGCMKPGWTISTCYGATWVYYRLPAGETGTTIPHYASYAPGATVKGCDPGSGYYRYAMVAHADQPSKGISKGDQVGVAAVGNPSSSYRSEFYGGGMKFIGGRALWNDVYNKFYSIPNEIRATFDQPEWNETSQLGWFCYNPDAGGGFASTSSVSVSGGGSKTSSRDGTDATVSHNLSTGVISATVTFWHNVLRTDGQQTAATTNWTVSGSGNNPASPTTGTFPSTAALRQQEVHRTSSITVNIAEGETKQVCQSITYTPKTLNGTDSGSSRACAIITRGKPGIIPSACPLPDSAYSIRYGGTQARSGVTNLTKDGTWKYTDGTSSTLAFVWAKPGDSIQFQHTLCFGVQNVRGSRDNGTSTSSPNDSVKPSTANKATIAASTKPATSGGKYLFGNTLNGGSTQTFTVAQGASKASGGSPDQSGDYWFTYYSPSNKAGETYKCYATDRGFPQFKSNGYQIPDFTSTTVPANCSAAKKASTNSDAGKVIEQKLTWNNVMAWQNTHNTGSGGSCSCNTQNAYASNTTHSYEDMKNGRYTPGTRVRKCFQASSTGCGWCSAYPSYGTRDYYYYPIETKTGANADQIAQVKVPFNYTTQTSVSTSQDILFGGGEYSVKAAININKRSNTDVSTSEYATISKSSVYEIVAFTVAPDASPASIAHADTKTSGNGSKLACSYYIKGASKCLSVYRSGTVQLNDKGSLHGSTENVFSGDLAVPDAEVGTKFCVAVGVWPSDSHNYTGGPAGTGDVALNISSGAYWNYSEPACRTITKKPTAQFHSAGVYSTGGITTSQTKKSVGYVFGSNGSGNKLQSGSLNSGNRRVFGSFSEYETIAKGTIKGFASGAGFGYGMNNGGNLTGSAALPGGYPNVPYTTEAKVCTYSTQTFNNDKCESKVTGASSINSLGSTILNRLTARYTDSSVKAMRIAAIDFSQYETLENGTKYIKVNGDAAISASYCMNQGNSVDNNTFVIDVSGTLTIGRNLKYGAGWGDSCAYQNYTNIAQLPQMLIFAGDINIRSNVTTIDAWLISGQRNAGNGNINTCSDMTLNQLGSGYTIPKQTNSVPCSSQLKVNGPVFAKKLILNRNAGAGTGNNSIVAAEVFNLRPDAYLWAFNQASRSSQAVTTYQRELAPRY